MVTVCVWCIIAYIFQNALFVVGEFVIANIHKGLRQDEGKANALKCLCLMLNLHAVRAVHGPMLLAELLLTVDMDSQHQCQAAGQNLCTSSSILIDILFKIDILTSWK